MLAVNQIESALTEADRQGLQKTVIPFADQIIDLLFIQISLIGQTGKIAVLGRSRKTVSVPYSLAAGISCTSIRFFGGLCFFR